MRAIQDYLSGHGSPRGCLVICTAVTEATGDPAIRSALAAILGEIDSMLAVRIAKAQAEGDRCTGGNGPRAAVLWERQLFGANR